MIFTLDGISSSVKAEQSLKAHNSMVVTLDGFSTRAKTLHWA
jgi:hypothetical protein